MEILGFIHKVSYPLVLEPGGFADLYRFMQISMFLLTLVGCVLVIFYGYISYKYPQFHANLAVLNANLFLSYFVLTAARQVILIAKYNAPNSPDGYVTQLYILKDFYYVEIVKYTSMIAFFVSAAWIACERIWASIYLKGYENKRNYKVIIGVVIFQWLTSFASVWLFFEGHLPFLPIFISSIFNSFIIAGAYCFMHSVNRRRHKFLKYASNSYSLSERFQLSENIRTAPIILSLIRYGLVFNTLMFISAGVVLYSSDGIQKHIAKLFWDLILTVYPFPLVTSIILGVRKWRNIIFKPIEAKRRQVSVEPTFRQKILTVDGKNVLFDVYMERRIYFEQLQKSWS